MQNLNNITGCMVALGLLAGCVSAGGVMPDIGDPSLVEYQIVPAGEIVSIFRTPSGNTSLVKGQDGVYSIHLASGWSKRFPELVSVSDVSTHPVENANEMLVLVTGATADCPNMHKALTFGMWGRTEEVADLAGCADGHSAAPAG